LTSVCSASAKAIAVVAWPAELFEIHGARAADQALDDLDDDSREGDGGKDIGGERKDPAHGPRPTVGQLHPHGDGAGDDPDQRGKQQPVRLSQIGNEIEEGALMGGPVPERLKHRGVEQQRDGQQAHQRPQRPPE
jgi:hypothetical protein